MVHQGEAGPMMFDMAGSERMDDELGSIRIGRNLPQEAPQAFATAVADEDVL